MVIVCPWQQFEGYFSMKDAPIEKISVMMGSDSEEEANKMLIVLNEVLNKIKK